MFLDIYIYNVYVICVLVRPFYVPTSCLFMGSTRSGSDFEGVKSLNIQVPLLEIRPQGS